MIGVLEVSICDITNQRPTIGPSSTFHQVMEGYASCEIILVCFQLVLTRNRVELIKLVIFYWLESQKCVCVGVYLCVRFLKKGIK